MHTNLKVYKTTHKRTFERTALFRESNSHS